MSNENWDFDSHRFEEAEANPLQVRRKLLLEKLVDAANEIAAIDKLDHSLDGLDPDMEEASTT